MQSALRPNTVRPLGWVRGGTSQCRPCAEPSYVTQGVINSIGMTLCTGTVISPRAAQAPKRAAQRPIS